MPVLNAAKTIVQIDPLGEVKLRGITVGDSEKFFKIIEKKNLTNKQFVLTILFNQLVEPKISKEEFNNISDENIKKIAKEFIDNEEYTFKNYNDTDNLYADFRKAIEEEITEKIKKLKEIWEPIYQQSASGLVERMKNIQLPIIDLNRFAFPMSEELERVMLLVKGVNLQPMLDTINSNTKSLEYLGTYWKNYFEFNEKINTNFFSVLTKQLTSPNLDFSSDLKLASVLTQENSSLFFQNIKTIHTYPKQEREEVLSTANIKPFTLDELEAILYKIINSVEVFSHIMFWDAKQEGVLAENLERIAQGHMIGMLYMGLPSKLVAEFQQLSSGAGIIDILIIFSNEKLEIQKVILELKFFGKKYILNDGIEQTAQYMDDQKTELGYRVIFNGTQGKISPQHPTASNGKKLKDYIVNINKPIPSKLDKPVF